MILIILLLVLGVKWRRGNVRRRRLFQTPNAIEAVDIFFDPFLITSTWSPRCKAKIGIYLPIFTRL